MFGFLKSKESRLLEAVKTNNLDKAGALISAGVDANLRNRAGEPCLFAATANNSTDMVKLLLAAGAQVNGADSRDVTPLMVAAGNGFTEVAGQLLAAGASVKARSKSGTTVLIEAAANHQTDMLRLLLSHGTNPDAKQNKGWCALHFCSANGFLEGVELLLEEGADADLQTGKGYTALAIAASNAHHPVMQALLAHGADPDKPNKQGQSPLQIAVAKGDAQAAGMLLAGGADIFAPDCGGGFIIDIALAAGNPDIVQLANERIAALDKEVAAGNIALVKRIALEGSQHLQQLAKPALLLYAVEAKQADMVDFLLGAGAVQAMNKRDQKNFRQHILEAAIQCGNRKVFKAMLGNFQKLHHRAISLMDSGKIHDKDMLEMVIRIKQQRQEKQVKPEQGSMKQAEPISGTAAQAEEFHLLQEICRAYAQNDPRYKTLEAAVKQLGEDLHRKGGLKEMRRAYARVAGIPGSRTLEMLWNGIGDWRG